ncbi:Ig-like domain-containing protein [Labilibacter marinus]|uniref:Ig-like domain-containing protein n=1 Tax=Labilibacter marinus TaxID=1477105 RepID=UPI00082C4B48|nr:Ig-like domain-containing protein [Labilibacter marinus]
MKKTHALLLVLVMTVISIPSTITAQALGYNNNRIACSADGNNQPDLEYTGTYNTADPDDWGATPMTLAIIAKAQLQDKLVHFSYNNFMPSPVHTTETNYMKQNAEDGATRFKFNTDVFFDVGTHKAEAILSLKNEIAKSTASDPLYFLHMGPSEFFYQAVKAVIDQGNTESLSHIYVISHSNYNDNHLRRDNEHTMTQCITLSGNRINYKLIKDQNTCNIGYQGLCSNTNFFQWQFLRDHRDPNLVWLWDRMHDHKHGKADVSDAGLIFYLLKNNENGSPSTLKTFFDYGILLPGDEIIENINITDQSVTIFPQRRYQLSFTTMPAEPWDNFYTWTTSNAEVAYISPTGRLVGVSPGSAKITIHGGVDGTTDEIDIKVISDSNCEDCTATCELIEKDGLLVFEAERFNLKGAWEVVENDNYASGGKYITYTGSNSYNNQNLANEISYTFTITNPGRYTVKWFMRQPDEAEGDLSNDVWVYIDGDRGYSGDQQLTSYKKFVGRSKTVFTMNGALDIDHHSYALIGNFSTAGDYTMKICGRSEHIQIDKFVFYKGLSGDDATYKASEVTETTTCMDDVISGDAEDTSIGSGSKKSKLKLFPNPMTNEFKIVANSPGTVQIFSMDGQMIQLNTVNTGINVIQLKDIKPGNYITYYKSINEAKRAVITVTR